MDQVVHSPAPAPAARRYDLRRPVGVFLVAFGVVKILELADWSRLHRDAGAMLALGSGAVTGLLIGAKTIELLLTVAAVLALVRHNAKLLIGALAGWTAEFALLAVMAAVHGDLARLIEHGLFCVAFGGLLTMTYALSPRPETASSPARPSSHSQEIVRPGPDSDDTADLSAAENPPPAEPVIRPSAPKDRPVAPRAHAVTRPEPLPGGERRPARSSDQTRQDLPVHRGDATRQDLPVRGGDATRLDLPVRRKKPSDDDA